MRRGVGCFWPLVVAVACGDGAVDPPDAGQRPRPDAGRINRDAGVTPDAEVTSDAGADSDAGAQADAGRRPNCFESTGSPPVFPSVTHGVDVASVEIVEERECHRQYQLTTTAPLRDSTSPNPRRVTEVDGESFLRTGNVLLDALYAMTNEERLLLSVEEIRNGSFDDGRAIVCGGCFETGRLWTWVWTRDTAYAADLALGNIDAKRAAASLLFKVSARRDGTNPQVIQDTGSGGSYPVSTDRVSWALGSKRTRAALSRADREAHETLARDALVNTIAHDREVVFDERDGLYRGEHSFLDWREQSYAPWTANDTVHIAMSKALSTNVLHLIAIRYVAELVEAIGGDASTYHTWANALVESIHRAFWIEDEGLWASHLPTALDATAARRFDLLGVSLAVVAKIGSPTDRARAVARYPHLPYGAPVLWPESREVPIYHNRAIWPFVTAYALRSAREVDNAAVITHAAQSLYDGAALNLSNMENLEVESGRAWVEDGANSGPVVNSERQLWSVAAFYSMVHDGLFGLETSIDGLRFRPAMTRALRRTWLSGQTSIALNDLPWRDGHLSVVLELPPEVRPADAMLTTTMVRLNGIEIGEGWITDDLRTGDDVVVVTLVDEGRSEASSVRLVTDGAIFAPPTPDLLGVERVGSVTRVTADLGGAPANARWSVYRDRARIAADLLAATSSFDDPVAADVSHCYAVESSVDGRASHRSAPRCYWGDSFERTRSYFAAEFVATGGTFVNNHGREHYEGWGDLGHELEVVVTPDFTGPHELQLSAGNGAGSVDAGITCGIKRVRVFDQATGTVLVSDFFVMPHLGAWSEWADSSFVSVDLEAGRAYRVVIDMDSAAVNMSTFEHYTRFTGGTGGRSGAFHRVNIAELKVLSRTGAP